MFKRFIIVALSALVFSGCGAVKLNMTDDQLAAVIDGVEASTAATITTALDDQEAITEEQVATLSDKVSEAAGIAIEAALSDQGLTDQQVDQLSAVIGEVAKTGASAVPMGPAEPVKGTITELVGVIAAALAAGYMGKKGVDKVRASEPGKILGDA